MLTESAVRIAVLLPDLLGTYGDRGNAIVLAHRLLRRGYDTEILDVPVGTPVPAECDIYLLGGGEDAATEAAVRALSAGAFPVIVRRGATVLAVCAGLQMLGEPGLGLVDLRTVPGRTRAVGEIVTHLDAGAEITPSTEGTMGDVLTGFENHRGRTALGDGIRPLARTLTGVGNGDGTEGVVSGGILGTYLHGPVLARNPRLADHLLTVVTGAVMPPLERGAVTENVAALRRSALRRARRRGRRLLARLAPEGWRNPGMQADFGPPGEDW